MAEATKEQALKEQPIKEQTKRDDSKILQEIQDAIFAAIPNLYYWEGGKNASWPFGSVNPGETPDGRRSFNESEFKKWDSGKLPQTPLPVGDVFFKEANAYFQELNSFIFDEPVEPPAESSAKPNPKSKTEAYALFPGFNRKFCSELISGDMKKNNGSILVKYLPYIMTAYYWNSNADTLQNVRDILGSRKNKSGTPVKLSTKEKTEIASLFSCSSFMRKPTGIHYSKLKLSKNGDKVKFSKDYQTCLETIFIKYYTKQYKLMGLLETFLPLEDIESLCIILKKMYRNPNATAKMYRQLVEYIFTSKRFKLCEYARVNPIINTYMKELKDDLLSKLDDKKPLSQIKQTVRDNVYSQEIAQDTIYPFIPFSDKTYPDAQKFHFKHLYLAMVYSVFVLASEQDIALKTKIDYKASYDLFQAHTKAFFVHPHTVPFFSLDDVQSVVSSAVNTNKIMAYALYAQIRAEDFVFYLQSENKYALIEKNIEKVNRREFMWRAIHHKKKLIWRKKFNKKKPLWRKNPQNRRKRTSYSVQCKKYRPFDRARLSLLVSLDAIMRSIQLQSIFNRDCQNDSAETYTCFYDLQNHLGYDRKSNFERYNELDYEDELEQIIKNRLEAPNDTSDSYRTHACQLFEAVIENRHGLQNK